MKNLENLLNRAENTLNGNFREDLIEAVKWALHFEDFQSKIDNNGNLIIASDEQENEVLECIFDDSEVQEVISKIERTTKNLGLFKRSKGSETAPSEQFAKKMINYFIEEYNLEKSGDFRVVTGHCQCGETQSLVYEIANEGILSVGFCEICGTDDAVNGDYVNINC